MQINQNRFEFWSEQIRLWKESSLSQAEYCKNNNLDQQLFSKWKIRILKINNNQQVNFVKIKPKVKKEYFESEYIKLIIKDKYAINIHSGFNKETLKNLLETIEGYTS